MISPVMLIDGDNMMYRAFFKFAGLTNEDGKPSSLVFGVPYMIRPMIFKYKPQRVIVVMDGGRHQSRTEVLPTYKLRDKSDHDYTEFKAQKEVLKGLLPALNCHVAYLQGHEADDIIYYLAKATYKYSEKVIVSSDKDFNQMIDSRTSIFNPSKNHLIDFKNCERVTGIHPHDWLDYLILDGDKSDKIPGYKGMGEKRIKKFLAEHSSIYEFLEERKSFSGIDNDKLLELYETNKKLISLHHFFHTNGKYAYPLDLAYDINFDKKKVFRTFADYNIESLMNDQFMKHFEELI